jgi:DNA-binding transcriptional MerR regulator
MLEQLPIINPKNELPCNPLAIPLIAEAELACERSLPNKKYFTIGETSKLCQVKPHVLRYWEQEFKQLKPAKRRGNRRYYQKKDILTIRHIRNLLYEQGFTIVGARQQLQHMRLFDADIQTAEEIIETSIKELEDLIAILENNPLIVGA